MPFNQNDFTIPLSLLGGTWSLDVRNLHLRWCRQTSLIHEAPRSFVPTALQVLELVDPGSRAPLLAALLDCISRGKPFETEVNIKTVKGNEKRVRLTGFADGPSPGPATTVKGIVQEVPLQAAAATPGSCGDLLDLQILAHAIPHELRAPLAAISGFSAALRDSRSHLLDDKGRHWLQRICVAARQMDELAESLMTLAPVATQPLKPAHFDISEICRELLDSLQERDPHRRVSVEIDSGVTAFGDAALIKLLVANLLSNAWKFTAREPDARISFACTRRDGRPVYAVIDNGVGFDMADVPAMFDMFCRLHDRHVYPGSGVGLALARRIVERHGGSIWAQGKSAEGAAFFFTLGDPAARKEHRD